MWVTATQDCDNLESRELLNVAMVKRENMKKIGKKEEGRLVARFTRVLDSHMELADP